MTSEELLSKAKDIQSSAAFNAILQNIQDAIIADWRTCPPSDERRQKELHAKMWAIDEFRRVIEAILNDEKVSSYHKSLANKPKTR